MEGLLLDVRVGREDEDGAWMVDTSTGPVPIDGPADLVRLVPAGAEVVADFGTFKIRIRRGPDGRPRYRGALGEVVGREDADEERALWDLLARLGDEAAPKACFFCRWSDVEPEVPTRGSAAGLLANLSASGGGPDPGPECSEGPGAASGASDAQQQPAEPGGPARTGAPNSGWGNLGCMQPHGAAYEAYFRRSGEPGHP